MIFGEECCWLSGGAHGIVVVEGGVGVLMIVGSQILDHDFGGMVMG